MPKGMSRSVMNIGDASEGAPAAPALDVEQLFDRYAGFVAKFLWKMGVPESEIDDLVQDVFVVVHQKGGFLEHSAKPTTWLASIAFKLWGTRLRRQRTRREKYDEEALMNTPSTRIGPAEQMDAARGVVRVRAALQELDESLRALLILVDIDGESCTEVAAALAIPVGTVYSRLHSARRRFGEAYERRLQLPHRKGGEP